MRESCKEIEKERDVRRNWQKENGADGRGRRGRRKERASTKTISRRHVHAVKKVHEVFATGSVARQKRKPAAVIRI